MSSRFNILMRIDLKQVILEEMHGRSKLNFAKKDRMKRFDEMINFT